MMGPAPVWPRLTAWAATIVLATLIGSWFGQALGLVLYRESYDYIVVADEFGRWGLRIGLLGGTLIAAAQVFGPRPAAHPARALASLLLIVVVTAAGCALGALALHVAHRTGAGWFAHWKLHNPSRHALLVGAVAGRDLGASLGVVLAMVYVAVGRGLAPGRLLVVGAACAAAWTALAWARPPLVTLVGMPDAPAGLAQGLAAHASEPCGTAPVG